jgi:hypothetical protein
MYMMVWKGICLWMDNHSLPNWDISLVIVSQMTDTFLQIIPQNFLTFLQISLVKYLEIEIFH